MMDGPTARVCPPPHSAGSPGPQELLCEAVASPAPVAPPLLSGGEHVGGAGQKAAP